MNDLRRYSFSSLLTITLCLLLLASLTVSLLANVSRTRDYLDEQLSRQAQDAATFMGLYLSPYMDDPNAQQAMIETSVSALFDSGYYHLVQVSDQEHHILYEKMEPSQLADVPAWFMATFPLHEPSAQAPVNSGWNQAGTVTITMSPFIAYRHLWSQSLESTLHYGLLFVASALLVWILTRRLTRTLTRLTQQAQAMTQRQFTVAAPEQTRIKELQWLLNAFHLLQQWLQRQLNLHDQTIQELEQRLYTDRLTGLPNRRALDRDFRAHGSEQEAHRFQGEALLISAPLLEKINQYRGFPYGNEYLLSINKIIKQLFKEEQIYRLSGREWLILSRQPQLTNREHAHETLGQLDAELVEQYASEPAISTQYAHINEPLMLGKLLALLDQQPLDQAWQPAQLPEIQDSRSQRHQALQQLLNNPVELNIQPILWQPPKAPWFAITTQVRSQDVQTLFEQAEHSGMSRALDTHILTNMFQQLSFLASPDATFVLRLSRGQLAIEHFVNQLIDLQRAHGFPEQQLILAIDADQHASEAVVKHIHKLKALGIRIMVVGAGDSLISLSNVIALAPDVIKLSPALLKPSADPTDTTYRRLVELIVNWAHSLDIAVIIDHIEAPEELQLADELDIEGRQGFLLGKPVSLTALWTRFERSQPISASLILSELKNLEDNT